MTNNVKESGDSKDRIITTSESEPSASMEAESILQSLLSSLRNPNFSVEELPYLMRSYMLSLRMLGIDDKWPSDELRGYAKAKNVPQYRRKHIDVSYVEAKSGNLVEKSREIVEFQESVAFITSHREKAWMYTLDGPKKSLGGKLVTTKLKLKPSLWDIDIILGLIAEELFDRASDTLVTARFGSAIDTIFRDYQRVVGSTLSSLEMENHLDTAYRNLKGGDEASWRAGALACRNVLHDLSGKLWCVECGDYNFGGGSGLVKLNNSRIKLRAYMREKGLDKKDTPVALLEPVYAQGSAAKIKCSYGDARSVLIVTYLFLAELIRKTDMKPVTELKKGSSKGKE